MESYIVYWLIGNIRVVLEQELFKNEMINLSHLLLILSYIKKKNKEKIMLSFFTLLLSANFRTNISQWKSCFFSVLVLNVNNYDFGHS